MNERAPLSAAARAASPGKRLERLVFFSDAVFAIALTLLVIDLRVPDLAAGWSEQDLAAALAGQLPRLLAYALSFLVIGLSWLAHWRRFALIERSDERLALLNLVLLAFIALVPFPTSLLGAYGTSPLVVVIYALAISATGLAGTASWLYAARAGLLRAGVDAVEVRIGTLRGLAIPLVMLGSLAILPFAGPGATELSWILIAPLHPLIERALRNNGGARRRAS
jgi:TMEM175 potassium channel family protein